MYVWFFLLNLACMLLCYLGHQPFSTPELPSLLRPNAASVAPTFPPVSASLSSLSDTLTMNVAAEPHAEWRFDYPPHTANQFERRHQVVPPMQIERPWNVFPLEQPVIHPPELPQPSLPFTVPTRTVPSSVGSSLQLTSNSSVVHSAPSQIALQPSSDGNTTSTSLDDELISWLDNIANTGNTNSLGADLDFNGILSNVINDSSARTDNAAAASVASTATTCLQTELPIPELQDTHYTSLLSQIEQLNKFGKPT